LRGPIGYDLVSLLKDCYISWSRERVERWVKGYRRVLGNLGANVGDSEYTFLRWFDLVGVQRHLKVLGIFCRLWYRDGKSGYLADLPLTFEYVRDACRRYPELVEFERWLGWRIAPLLPGAIAREQSRALALARERAARPRRPIKKKSVKRRAAKKAVRRKPARRKPARVIVRRKPVRKKPVPRKAVPRKVVPRKVVPRKVVPRKAVRARVSRPKIVRRKPARVQPAARKQARLPKPRKSRRPRARRIRRRPK
jgi:hypothetical protein